MTAHPGTDPAAVEVDAAWEAWMAAWERFLDEALALPDAQGQQAPELPAVAMPLGDVPGWLTPRLLRAQAVKDAAIEAIGRHLAQRAASRRFTTGEQRPGTRVCLEL